MLQNNHFTFINPQTGNLAFKLYNFEKENPFDHIQRLNYYSLIWVKNGVGNVKADFSNHEFQEHMLFSFSPYQPFTLKTEMQKPDLAQYELLISYLKIFLISASRLKTEQQVTAQKVIEENKEPFILQNLKSYIESHYKTKHTASDYAEMLSISPKALSKLTKAHFNKTLTDLIAERIIIEAKRELYLTDKTVKEIAYELGYNDEYYFSRFFKKNANVSPQLYRETVGFDRASTT